MSEAPRLTAAKQAEQAARAERLAKALRDNLHRRKQQARDKASVPPPETGGTGPSDGLA